MPIFVDTSGLTRAIAERLRYPGRSEAKALNTAAYWIARNTLVDTPFASMQKIDASLNVQTSYRLVSRGPNKGRVTKRNPRYTYGKFTWAKSEQVREVELVRLIIIARANLTKQGRDTGQSGFNERTNDRYVLLPSDLRGGESVMQALMRKMTAMRHSSSKFIRSGWVPAIDTLEPFADKGGRSGVGFASEKKSFHGGDNVGSATVAVEGSWNVSASIENARGLAGKNSANVNKALIEFGLAPLQRAVAREESQLLEYIEKQNAKANARFNQMCAA